MTNPYQKAIEEIRARSSSSQTYRCCPHCKDDAIHDIPKDGHDLPCDLCSHDAAIKRVEALASEFEKAPRGEVMPVSYAASEIRRVLRGNDAL